MSEQVSRKEEKRALRRRILALRDALDKAEAHERSHRITDRILKTDFYRKASCLYAYIDTRNEFQTRELIETAWHDGKRVAVPRVEGQDLVFYYIHTWDDLSEGFRGIREPKLGCQEAREEDAILILPGVAYDQQCNRIGYGGGFYDRYLAVHTKHPLLAPAYDFQMVPELPVETFDQNIHTIVTETREFGLYEGGKKYDDYGNR